MRMRPSPGLRGCPSYRRLAQEQRGSVWSAQRAGEGAVPGHVDPVAQLAALGDAQVAAGFSVSRASLPCCRGRACRLRAGYAGERQRLEEAESWRQIEQTKRDEILSGLHIEPVSRGATGTEHEVLESLAHISLDAWRTRTASLPQLFAQARAEADRMVEPKIRHVKARQLHLVRPGGCPDVDCDHRAGASERDRAGPGDDRLSQGACSYDESDCRTYSPSAPMRRSVDRRAARKRPRRPGEPRRRVRRLRRRRGNRHPMRPGGEGRSRRGTSRTDELPAVDTHALARP